MKRLTRVLLALMLCLALWIGALAEQTSGSAGWPDSRQNPDGGAEERQTDAADAITGGDDAIDVDDSATDDEYEIVYDEPLPDETPAVRDVVLMIPNEGTNDVLSADNLDAVKLAAALIVNALSGTGAKVTIVGTVPQVAGEPAVATELDTGSANAVAEAVDALEAMPSGSGSSETTYLREKVDALAGESTQRARLAVVLLDGKNRDPRDEKFDAMVNRSQMSGDRFKMLFLGLNSDKTAVENDVKIIGQLTDDQYGEADYVSPLDGACEDRATAMANRVLGALGLEGYVGRDLRDSRDLEVAKALLRAPVFLCGGAPDEPQSVADPETADADGSAAEAAEPTLDETEIDGGEAFPGDGTQASEGARSVENAIARFSFAAGGRVVTDLVPENAQAVRALWSAVKAVEIDLADIDDVGPEHEEVRASAMVLADGEATDVLPISYTLNGEPLADATVPSDLLAGAGSYTLAASVESADYGIADRSQTSFRVLGVPVFVGNQTRFQVADTVDAPNTFTVLEDRFALFVDPNGEGISSVEVSLPDASLSNVSDRGLVLQGDMSEPEKTLTATLIATNAANYSIEQPIGITLKSNPAIISGADLVMSGLEGEYVEGDPVEVSLSLSNSAFRELSTAVDDAWLDHIAVYVSLNGAPPVVAEGNIDGWTYTAQAALGENVLSAWLTVDSIRPESFNMELSASSRGEFAAVAPTIPPTASPVPTEPPVETTPEPPVEATTSEPPLEKPVPGQPTEASKGDGPEEPTPHPAPSASFLDRLIESVGVGGIAAICAGIALLIAAAVLGIRRTAAPRFEGVLHVKVVCSDGTFTSDPIDLSEWGKKTVIFGNLVSQSGLPPIGLLTSGDIAEKLQFKPARDGILIVNRAHSLHGDARAIITNRNSASYTIKDNRIEFTYRR